jgi:exosome complex component RRP41
MPGRRTDYLSEEGLRIDGRRAGEARRMRCRLGAAAQADGSCYLELGNTKVLVTVIGPHEARGRARKEAQHDRAVLTCAFVPAPYATGQHRATGGRDRGSAELAMEVRQVFEHVVQVQLYAHSQIDVSIVLLQADGGVRSAALNATTLALVDAGIALEDFVCACSVASIQGALLLDPNSQEDSVGAELSVGYLARSEKVACCELESKLPLSALEETLNFAVQGCTQLYEVMRDAVQVRMAEQLSSRGGVLNS